MRCRERLFYEVALDLIMFSETMEISRMNVGSGFAAKGMIEQVAWEIR